MGGFTLVIHLWLILATNTLAYTEDRYRNLVGQTQSASVLCAVPAAAAAGRVLAATPAPSTQTQVSGGLETPDHTA